MRNVLILTCFRLSLATVPLMNSIAELILKQIEAKSSGPQAGCVVWAESHKLRYMHGIFLVIHGARKLQSHDLMAATAIG